MRSGLASYTVTAPLPVLVWILGAGDWDRNQARPAVGEGFPSPALSIAGRVGLPKVWRGLNAGPYTPPPSWFAHGLASPELSSRYAGFIKPAARSQGSRQVS